MYLGSENLSLRNAEAILHEVLFKMTFKETKQAQFRQLVYADFFSTLAGGGLTLEFIS